MNPNIDRMVTFYFLIIADVLKERSASVQHSFILHPPGLAFPPVVQLGGCSERRQEAKTEKPEGARGRVRTRQAEREAEACGAEPGESSPPAGLFAKLFRSRFLATFRKSGRAERESARRSGGGGGGFGFSEDGPLPPPSSFLLLVLLTRPP
uniref:Uncharacterized protein n=1 Tax=Micrurus lemniscatus lemniscatus TaxID=129467 RepID=A0A2D4J1W7_MICLE